VTPSIIMRFTLSFYNLRAAKETDLSRNHPFNAIVIVF